MEIIVRDFGPQVDPASIHSRDLDDVRPGGLGVHIIRSIMRDVDYSCPPDGGMQLRMVYDPNRPIFRDDDEKQNT